MEKIVMRKKNVETPSMIVNGDVYAKEDGQKIRVVGVKDGVVFYSLEHNGKIVGNEKKERDYDIFIEMLKKHGFGKDVEQKPIKKLDDPGKGDGPNSLKEKIIEKVGEKQGEINEAVYERIAKDQLPEKIEKLQNLNGDNDNKKSEIVDRADKGEKEEALERLAAREVEKMRKEKSEEEQGEKMEALFDREYKEDFEKMEKARKARKEKIDQVEGDNMEAFIKNNYEKNDKVQKTNAGGGTKEDKSDHFAGITTETVVVGEKKPEEMTQEEIDQAAEDEMGSRIRNERSQKKMTQPEIDEASEYEMGDRIRMDKEKENEKDQENRNIDLEQLRQEVEQARKEFLEVDYRKNKAYKRLGKFFGRMWKNKEDELRENDQDIAWCRAHYDNKLFDYRNALLEDAKARGASNRELGEIAKMFLVEANLNMAETHDQVKVEKHEGRAPEFMKNHLLKMSDWYRKLPFAKKLAFGAALGFGTLAAGATGSALLIGTAASAATIRRAFLGMVTGTGVAMTAEAVTQKRRAGKTEKESTEFSQELEGLSAEEALARVEEKIKNTIFDEKQTINSIKNKNLRNLGIGVVAGFTSAVIAPKVFGYLSEKTGAGELFSKAKGFVGEAYDKYFGSGKTDFSGGRMGGWDEPGAGGPSKSLEGQRMGGWDEPGGADQGEFKFQKPDTSPEAIMKEPPTTSPGLGETYTENSLGMDMKKGYAPLSGSHGVVGSDASTGYEGRGWKISGVETAGKGNNSIWKMLNHQLEERFSQNSQFASLSPEQKTYIIDHFKDQVAKNPKAFDLENIDKLRAGQKVDFSRLFETNEEFQKAMKGAQGLTQEQMENIGKNNKTLVNWVKTHPGEPLTSPKVNDILGGKGSVAGTVAESKAGTAGMGTERVFNLRTEQGFSQAIEENLKGKGMVSKLAREKAAILAGERTLVPKILPDGTQEIIFEKSGTKIRLSPDGQKILSISGEGIPGGMKGEEKLLQDVTGAVKEGGKVVEGAIEATKRGMESAAESVIKTTKEAAKNIDLSNIESPGMAKEGKAYLATAMALGFLNLKTREKMNRNERVFADFLTNRGDDLKMLINLEQELEGVEKGIMEASKKEEKLADLRGKYNSVLTEIFGRLRGDIASGSRKIKIENIKDMERVMAKDFLNSGDETAKIFKTVGSFYGIKLKKNESLREWTKRLAARMIKESSEIGKRAQNGEFDQFEKQAA